MSTAGSSRTASTSPRTLGARGIGRLLLEHLVSSTEEAGVWTIQTGIFPENAGSVHLHEQVGFEIVGRRKWLGKLNGVWRDVILLERRSPTIN